MCVMSPGHTVCSEPREEPGGGPECSSWYSERWGGAVSASGLREMWGPNMSQGYSGAIKGASGVEAIKDSPPASSHQERRP